MKLILIIMTLFPSTFVQAGDKIGNGGGLWACVNPQQIVLYGQLVDLYEAQQEFGLRIIETSSQNPNDIFNERKAFLKLHMPELAVKLESSEQLTMSQLRFVDSVLTVIDDSLFRLSPLPVTCPDGSWQYLQFANYTNLDQVLIRRDLWNHSGIKAIDKAALLWHEVIYLWLRNNHDEPNSIRTRMIVGLLFSDLPGQTVKSKIDEILKKLPKPKPSPVEPTEKWVCMSKNSHESLIFAGYGMVKREAESAALKSCQSKSDAFFCAAAHTCEEITSQSQSWFCEVENTHESKVFGGKGRNKIEATFEALNACQTQSQGFFCSEQKVSCSN